MIPTGGEGKEFHFGSDKEHIVYQQDSIEMIVAVDLLKEEGDEGHWKEMEICHWAKEATKVITNA